MKYKLFLFYLIIFILIIIIYLKNDNDNTIITYIGDNHLIKYIYNIQEDNKNKLFTFDNFNYQKLNNYIIKNAYIYYKNKKIYINNLINKSNYIIINANNNEFLKDKCYKSEQILSNYIDYIDDEIYELINKIKKMSNAKIILIENYCENKKIDMKIDTSEDYILIKNYNLNNIDLIIEQIELNIK